MFTVSSCRIWLAAALVLTATSLPASAEDPNPKSKPAPTSATPLACDQVAKTLEPRTAHESEFAQLQKELDEALKRCGEGHGISALQALLEIGSSAEMALHQNEPQEENLWKTQVLCPDGVRGQNSLLGKPGIFHDTVTCTDGTKRELWTVLDQSIDEPIQAETGKVSKTPFIDELLPKLAGRFGIRTAAELRAELAAISPTSPNRGDAWLVSWVGDLPAEIDVWRHLVQEDPTDLEATVELIRHLQDLGDLEGALKIAEAAPIEKLRLVDTRGPDDIQPHSVLARRCTLLWQLGREQAARDTCAQAIAAGNHIGAHLTLARMDFVHGKLTEALSEVDAVFPWAMGGDRMAAHALRGAILLGLKRDFEADQQLTIVVQHLPGDTETWQGLHGKVLTGAEWEASKKVGWQRDTGRSLAKCGHIFLELGLAERAAHCFAEADRLSPGLADAERLAHQAESDPEAALKEARQLVAGNKSVAPTVLSELAKLELDSGHEDLAEHAAVQALDADPGLVRARKLLETICAARPTAKKTTSSCQLLQIPSPRPDHAVTNPKAEPTRSR
jgi:tetratricopeptide (TPR) repeat protein